MTGSLRARLQTAPWVARVRAFLYSRGFVWLVAALCAVSYVSGGELVVWSLYAAMAFVVLVLCPDLTPIIPLTLTAVFCLSVRHAPMRPTYSDYLFSGHHLVMIIVMSLVVIIGWICHIWIWGFRLPDYRGTPHLLWVSLPLALCLLLNGVGRDGWAWKNLLFGAITAFCWCGLYLVYTVQLPRGEKTREYLFDCCFAIAWLLLFELAFVILRYDVIVDGAVRVSRLVMGWGIHNGIGIMLALLIPLMLRQAAKRRYAPVYYLTAILLLLGVGLTTSRGSLLVGMLAFVAGSLILCFSGEDRRRWRICFALTVVIAALGIIVFHEQILTFLPRFRADKLNDNGRFELWREGWELFLGAPIFGAGFAAISFKSWAGGLFPGYLHNTVFELLGAGGGATLAAYLAYRVRSVTLFVQRPTLDRTFMGLAIAVLLGGSLVDNHVFNIYPTFFYALLLVFSEGDARERAI